MDNDIAIRLAAFQMVEELERMYGDTIPWAAIKQGFIYSGQKVLLANQVQGIFKPKILQRGPISIKTTIPKGDRENIYNDQLTDSGFYQYSLEEGDPYGERNVLLWQALEDKSPFIYFHAVAPGVYKAIWPCFVRKIIPDQKYSEITVGKTITGYDENLKYEIPTDIESKYLVQETKVRLHQASFREAVLRAYHHKCAITGLPITQLLEAAHIIPDAQIGGIQTISNGISLSRLHHKAYDANLLGIDPDYKIHISERLFVEDGGPLIDKGFLEFDGKIIDIPSRSSLQPNRDFLARRYEEYQLQN